MKKILLIFTTLVLSSCAILMGTSMRPIILGKMLIYVRTSTAKAFIATEMPEKLEIDTPFYVSGRFDYRNAIHDTTKGIASVTLDNRDLFQNDISDSLKTTKIFSAYEDFFPSFTKENLVDADYNSEKKYTYRCYKIKTPKDICIASRLTPKGNIIIAFMRSLTYDTDVKATLLEAIESVEFKN